jgi:hypothetical protein
MLATWTTPARSSIFNASRLACRRTYATAGTTGAAKPKKPSRPLLGRYTDTFPCELARVQSGRNVHLRDYEEQRKLGRVSYDLKLKDGKVMPAEGPNFIGPCLLCLPISYGL